MKFEYFTYFLNPTGQKPLFPEKQSKKEILKNALKKKMEYKHRGTDMIYIFHKEEGDFLQAKLGRKSFIRRNIPEENDFAVKEDVDYPYCNVLFNLDNSPETGQRIAFEYNQAVFQSPRVQIDELEEQINLLLLGSGFAISINPIFDQKDFWNLVEKYQGDIERLIFSYAVPNLFDLKNSLSDDLKNSGKKYGITNTTIEFENKAGKLTIPKDDIFMQQSAEYTSKGGGFFRLKVKGINSEFKSKKNVKTREIQNIDLATPDQKSFEAALKIIFNK